MGKMPRNRGSLVLLLGAFLGADVSCSQLAAIESLNDDLTIETLLKDGWQIAGYTGAVDNWSTFILFRHPDRPYLVQCRAGYDVTREPRTQSHCYRLH
jgi:hypothetical protein